MAKTNKQMSEELDKKLDALEYLKDESNYLRGTIEQGLADHLLVLFQMMTLNY